MGELVKLNNTLETVICWAHAGCGVQFAIPQQLLATIEQHGGVLYCPKGHRLGFGESETMKLKKQLAAKDAQLASQKKRTEWANEATRKTERKLIAQKGVTTRLKNRASAGLCPCCKRSFQDLKRHMKSKHPEVGGGRDV